MILDVFRTALEKVGGVAVPCDTPAAVVAGIAARSGGPLLLPPSPGLRRLDLASRLRTAGIEVIDENFRGKAPDAVAGLTGANLAIAATGTIVLDSTAEPVRLASTLPPRHFVLLDPRKIVANAMAAVPLLRRLHERQPQTFVAYITGPSRTADIERVLTIGVHGPKELYVLLCEGVSDDVLEA